jgi:sulfonate transport system permease protein
MKCVHRSIDPIGLVLPLVLLLIWYFATDEGRLPSYLLPSPVSVIRVLFDYIGGTDDLTPYSGKLFENLTASLFRVLKGFGIATVNGLFLGILTGRINIIKRIIDPLIHAVRTVPGIGWLPVAMVWFGFGERTTVFLISLAAFFPIYLNAAIGASRVPAVLLQAGRMMGANKIDEFRTIILPSSLPSILIGLRLGLGVSWAYLVLGELTGVSEGLGAVMMDSRMLGQNEMVLVSMIIIAIVGVFSDWLLIRICQFVLPYGEGDL